MREGSVKLLSAGTIRFRLPVAGFRSLHGVMNDKRKRRQSCAECVEQTTGKVEIWVRSSVQSCSRLRLIPWAVTWV